MIIFFDLDWTIADCRHRLLTMDGASWTPGAEYFNYYEIDWDVFNNPENVLEDPVFDCAAEVAALLRRAGHEIVYLTCRLRKIRGVSAEWLWKQGFPYGKLYCCSREGSPDCGKEEIFFKYRSEIEKFGAVLYDDDWSGEWAPAAERYGVRHIMPDYVFGKSGFWFKEKERLETSGWNP